MIRPGLNTAMLVALTGLGLGGCFFSVHSNTCANDASLCVVPASTSIGGKVTDGTVAYATVTLDQNDDRICEDGERTSQTDANGNYSFPSSLGQHMVCAEGGTDIATGLPFIGRLLAPAGSTQITPLTNLVMAQLNAANPPVANKASPIAVQDAYSAAAAIANQLGLGSGESLLTADPVAQADSNPALLQTTAALQALMVQTVSMLQAAGGDDTAEAGSANTDDLYTHAGNALAALLKAPAPALTTGSLGSVAGSLLHDTLSGVKSDATLLAKLPKLGPIDPDSLAAFAGPTLAGMTNAVAASSASSLLLPNQYNQAALQQGNVALANTVAALGPVLLVPGVTLSGGATLASLASVALPLSNAGVPRAAPGNTTIAAITGANDAIQIPGTLKTDLDNANMLNNVTQIAGIRINCGQSGCASAKLVNNNPLVASMTSVGPFTNVVISLQQPVGVAIKGSDAPTLVAVGNNSGQAISGTEHEVSLTISVIRTDTSSPEVLTLQVDHLVMYQTYGTLAVGGGNFVALTGAMRFTDQGLEPHTTMTVSGVNSLHRLSKATLSPDVASKILMFPSVLSSASNSSDIILDINELIKQIGPQIGTVTGTQTGTDAVPFPALKDFSSGLAGSGKTFLITTKFSGVTMATLSTQTPARSKTFAMQVGF